MAASPVNGERPSRGGFRRPSSNFASIPQRSLSFHEQAGLAKDDAAANVLYTHPNVRIYKFQPPTDALKSLDKTKKTLPDADYPIDAIEVLPWRSRTEMLSAKGRLIIEKVQGSVHFLKAGELIHTIMKNSQCWCVDGESKFVMRVGNLRYQRIEFPAAEDEEKKKVEEFKAVISKILRFEKTPCPFIRGFHVDLPEDAITPRRRGTWKRRESLTPITPDEESPAVRKSKASRTMSMRGMPPSSFPSRSMSQLDMERPRTASTPTASPRFSFPDVRTESPTNYTSGEENTDSDRHDSEPEKQESSHHSEADESESEAHNVPIIRSPLKIVQTISSVENQDLEQQVGRSHQDAILRPIEQTLDASTESPTKVQPVPGSAEIVSVANGQADTESAYAKGITKTTQETVTGQESIETPSSTTPAEFEVKTVVPVSGRNNMEDNELKPKEITASREVVDSGQKLSLTQEGSDHKKSEKYEEIPIAERGLSSDHFQVDSSSAAQFPHHNAETLETILQAPPISANDNTSGHAADQHQSQDHYSKQMPAAVTHAEALSEASTEDLIQTDTRDETESILSTDSFHTLLSDDSPIVAEGFLNTRPFQHRRELSEMTVTAPSINHHSSMDEDDGAVAAMSSYEPFSADFEPWLEQQTPGAFINGPELRQRLSHRRSLSPLPPASILTQPHQNDHGSPIPKELFQKAATLAVVKPIEIVIFMVHILSRIAQGATMSDLMSGDLFRRPGARRTATGTFDQNIRGRSLARDSEDEDDYGFGRRMGSNREPDRARNVNMNERDEDAASLGSID